MATHDYEQAMKMLGVGNGLRSRPMSGAEFMDEVQELWGTNGNTVYVIADGKRYFVKDIRSDEDNNIVLEASE